MASIICSKRFLIMPGSIKQYKSYATAPHLEGNLWYNAIMKEIGLIYTNPHLKDPTRRAEAICRSVQSSSAVENIHVEVKAQVKNGIIKFTAASKTHF